MEKLETEAFAAIGRVASEWSYLEITVDYHSIILGGIQEDFGICLTAQISGVRRKLDAYVAIMRLRGGEAFEKQVNKIAEEIVSLSERRNRVVHDPWTVDREGTPRRYEASARRRHKQQLVHVPTAEIIKLSAEISEKISQFKKLADLIYKHVEALPKSSP